MNLLKTVNFAFIPLNERTIPRYVKGLKKSYMSELNQSAQKQVLNRVLGGPFNEVKHNNLIRGATYLEDFGKMPIDGLYKNKPARLIPLTTNVNGKETTVGLRGIKLDPLWNGWDGLTVTHPKYKNHGADALISTMGDYAKDRPDEKHMIIGASDGLDRLYRKKMKQYNTPSNLQLVIG